MDEERKRMGRQISALRAACDEAAGTMHELRHIVHNSEPDAEWMAEEGEEKLRIAIRRSERIQRQGAAGR